MIYTKQIRRNTSEDLWTHIKAKFSINWFRITVTFWNIHVYPSNFDSFLANWLMFVVFLREWKTPKPKNDSNRCGKWLPKCRYAVLCYGWVTFGWNFTWFYIIISLFVFSLLPFNTTATFKTKIDVQKRFTINLTYKMQVQKLLCIKGGCWSVNNTFHAWM